MPAGRTCPKPGCPAILTRGERYCPEHMAQYEAKRGTSTQRGYGARHQSLRRAWQARIDKGERVMCARCGQPLGHDTWALDHTDDRATYLGPSHTSCNNSAGGRKAHI